MQNTSLPQKLPETPSWLSARWGLVLTGQHLADENLHYPLLKKNDPGMISILGMRVIPIVSYSRVRRHVQNINWICMQDISGTPFGSTWTLQSTSSLRSTISGRYILRRRILTFGTWSQDSTFPAESANVSFHPGNSWTKSPISLHKQSEWIKQLPRTWCIPSACKNRTQNMSPSPSLEN